MPVSRSLLLTAAGGLLAALVLVAADSPPGKPLTLPLRDQVESKKGSGEFRTRVHNAEWDPQHTAAVVCDAWDKHWSTNATARVAEMAPRMNDLLTALRRQGVLIIHCPSDTMSFYKDTPQRKRAQEAPPATPKVPLKGWCGLDPKHEPPLPIDDSDGGDDTVPPCKSHRAWSRQIATLSIAPEDAVTDSGEAYNLMRQRGITNVLVMGVHLNMCVLGRPFAIRQLVAQGLNVALVRDLTDTMYNPRRRPFVSHFTGTDLMVDHVERYWCPSVTSADVLGGKPFRFKDDTRKHLAILSAEDEYRTERTLPAFARDQLGKDFRVSVVLADPADRNRLPGVEVLDEADVALFSIRRRSLPAAEMAVVRRFVAAGKAVVGVRTASHSFAPLDKTPTPAGQEYWPAFDTEVLGCKYAGHHGSNVRTTVHLAPGVADHPILTGLPAGESSFRSWLYRVLPLAEGATPLWIGRAGEARPEEPVAWTWTRPDGGRTFSTTLGHPDDFANPLFAQLLRNGVYWSAKLPVPKEAPALPTASRDWSSAWGPMTVPGCWEDSGNPGLEQHDGFAWYRCFVELPAGWKEKELTLTVEKVDNAHEAYFDGKKVGGAGGLPPSYRNGDSEICRYALAPEQVREGRFHTIAIRVYDAGGRGGFKGAAPVLACAGERLSLAGVWQFRTGDQSAWAAPADEKTAIASRAIFRKVEAVPPATKP